jgi:hypothetical protein
MDNQAIEIQFPIGMLWADADPDDYLADDTETWYADAVSRALYKAGYDATVRWSNVVTTTILDADGEPIVDDRYNEIRGIIDSVEVDYIEDDD